MIDLFVLKLFGKSSIIKSKGKKEKHEQMFCDSSQVMTSYYLNIKNGTEY